MTLEKELETEKVSHLNLTSFCEVSKDTLVRDVLALMRAKGHHVCLVKEDDDLIGIFTDRDVLRKIVTSPGSWKQPISDFMTPDPITVKPDTSAADALDLMDDNHFRNLPVLDKGGAIVGNLTHQVVVEYLAGLYPVEVLNQPPRPDRFPRRVEGG